MKNVITKAEKKEWSRTYDRILGAGSYFYTPAKPKYHE